MSTYDTVISSPAELDAVNDILLSIGEPPVNTLEGDSNADVASARRILASVNRTIQSKGWTFNIEPARVLQPDVYSKMIEFSPDWLSIMGYVNRGGYLYDQTNQTDQFSSSITVKLIALRPFDEMPECFRNWIVAKAARRFNMSLFGAPEIDATLADDEREAKMQSMEYELDYGGFNMMDGDAFVGSLLSR